MTAFAAYGQDSGLRVQQLTPLLRQLGLSGVLESLEVRHHQAIQEEHSYVDFLARLLQDEIERRAQKKLAVRLKKADLGSQKTVEAFDFHFNPTVNRQQVYDSRQVGIHRAERERAARGSHRSGQDPSGTGVGA